MKFKAEALAWDFKEKRVMENNMSLREAADEIGVGYSTLSRLENCKDIDLVTFTKVVSWLQKNPGRYFTKDINITTLAESEGKVVVKTGKKS